MKRALLYIIIKQAAYQKNPFAVNMDAVNITSPRYIKKILTELKEEVDSSK